MERHPSSRPHLSWLGIPLIAAGNVLGILSLTAPTPEVFTTEHLRLAKSLAVSAAVAIQNARTHARAEIYAAELELRLRELYEAQRVLEHAGKHRPHDPTIDNGTYLSLGSTNGPTSPFKLFLAGKCRANAWLASLARKVIWLDRERANPRNNQQDDIGF